jgi:hypothetical protein
MPELREFAEEQGVHRFSDVSLMNLAKVARSAPISDAGALYRQKVRRAMCPGIDTWAWFVSVKTGRGGLLCAGEAESTTSVLRKMTRFEPTVFGPTVAARWFTYAELNKADFGGGCGAHPRPLAETFVQRAQRLDKGGHSDAALDLIYDSVDELMQKEDFPKLDSILAKVRASDHSVDVLLGILTATLPARNRLRLRAKLFKDIERLLRERGEYEQGLLTGLEG